MTDGDMKQQRPEQAKRGVSLWLAVSLAANALLLGVVGGKMLARDDREDGVRHEPREFQRDMRDRALSSIDRERRVKLRKVMKRVWQDTAPVRVKLDEARKAAVRAAAADPYDETAMAASLADIRNAEAELRRHVHEAIADILSDATPEERLEVVRRFSGMRPTGDLSRRDGDKHGDGRRDRSDQRPPPREFGPPPMHDGAPPPPRPEGDFAPPSEVVEDVQ